MAKGSAQMTDKVTLATADDSDAVIAIWDKCGFDPALE